VKLEYQKNTDKLYNFGATEYNPNTTTFEGKLKSSNIFNNSIHNTTYENKINLLLDELDVDKTCWGIKNVDGKLEWELYFYDTLIDIPSSLDLVHTYFNTPLLDKQLYNNPYLMWSFDINDNKQKEINLYLNDLDMFDRDLFFFGGRSYAYNGIDYKCRNTYYFWKNSIQNLDMIKDVIMTSPFVNDDTNIHDILIPEFIDYYIGKRIGTNTISFSPHDFGIVTTNKVECDSIYYMSLDVDMLLVFLKRFNYPLNQIEFIEDNKDNLNHLLYDVSINYKMDGEEFKVLKSGYYGQV